MFVLVVSLRVKPGGDRQVVAAIEADAAASLLFPSDLDRG